MRKNGRNPLILSTYFQLFHDTQFDDGLRECVIEKNLRSRNIFLNIIFFEKRHGLCLDINY